MLIITEERLKWLNFNKKRGEVEQAVNNINAKLEKGENKFTLDAAYKYLQSNTISGKYTVVFYDELEKIIRKRFKRLEEEKLKYA